MKYWALGLFAFIGISALCSFLDGYEEKLVDQEAKQESIQQAKKEHKEQQREWAKLNAQSEYMTGMKTK